MDFMWSYIIVVKISILVQFIQYRANCVPSKKILAEAEICWNYHSWKTKNKDTVVPPTWHPHPFMMHLAPSGGNLISPGGGRATAWISGVSGPDGTGSFSFTSAISLVHMSVVQVFFSEIGINYLKTILAYAYTFLPPFCSNAQLTLNVQVWLSFFGSCNMFQKYPQQ